jgi:hypothetical protein
MVLLTRNPAGLSAEDLGRLLYGADFNPVTVRAEISRLRRLLGAILLGDPYRLDADVSADLGDAATPSQPPA